MRFIVNSLWGLTTHRTC